MIASLLNNIFTAYDLCFPISKTQEIHMQLFSDRGDKVLITEGIKIVAQIKGTLIQRCQVSKSRINFVVNTLTTALFQF